MSTTSHDQTPSGQDPEGNPPPKSEGQVSDGRRELAALADEAVALARHWAELTQSGATRQERATSDQLASLLRDEKGLDLAVRFVDRVARPEDPAVAAKELARLTTGDAGSFLGTVDQALLGLGAKAATLAPPIVIPIARKRLRQIVGHLVVDAHDPALGKHLAKARAEGFRLNVNLLGEAVLGEEEAAARTERTRQLLERPDIDYVSIKVSSLVSQISTWDTEGTVARVLERLRPIYRTAAAKTPAAFVNLDMEEYRDLDLTIEVFTAMLAEPEFHHLEAGIVLQAYLPDALPALERLLDFARERRAAGRAPIKVRIVKGANLAMERVEAQVHGWAQAPYATKEDVDANYLRMVERALRPDAVEVMRVGVASHNLFDVAAAYLLAKQRGALAALDIEMLQGMAPAQARAVRDVVGTVVLYTPVVAPEDFDVAVSYLIRRLEENAEPRNFLHAMFSADETDGQADEAIGRSGADGVRAAGAGSHQPMSDQEHRFRDSIAAMDATPIGPRRTGEPTPVADVFANTADSDPALPQHRELARRVAETAGVDSAAAATSGPSTSATLTSPFLRSVAEVDAVVATAAAAADGWAGRPAAERAAILREAARELERRRWELVAVMMREGGKTVDQADPEVSEAIDFARYYADHALGGGAPGGRIETERFTPDRVVLVTPPWNFPVAIPAGGVLAALAAGAAVVIKPAAPVVGCVELVVAALHAAGVPAAVLQVVRTEENEVGQALVAHRDVDTVVLTGAIETARLFASWRTGRPRGPRVLAETSGKNALVITPAADLDLAAADLMRSAFGHAGQKCSAASLGILVGSVGRSERFRRQLIDAVSSLRVGWPQDLGVGMGPVIEPPTGKLLRALTTLEPGERWLVEPRQLDATGRLWSPGLKDGVRPGSFFHTTEVFGPVLGLMHASSLEEAIAWQNGTAFGLTGGLHSLDEEEIASWREHVEVGNAYINRVTTGAIVQRQSFGGWKDSAVGPGAKAGGPNYVAQLGIWEPIGSEGDTDQGSSLPGCTPTPTVTALVDQFAPFAGDRLDEVERAVRSDALAWRETFGVESDESGLMVESNVFRYRPYPQVVIRATTGTHLADVLRLLAAGVLAGAQVTVSLDPSVYSYEQLRTGDGPQRQAYADSAAVVTVESVDDFARRELRGVRVRLIGDPDAVIAEVGVLERTEATLLPGPVHPSGQRELLTFLREQAISRTLHRFGTVPPQLRR